MHCVKHWTCYLQQESAIQRQRAGAQLTEASGHKLESRGLDSRAPLEFSIGLILSSVLRPTDQLSNLPAVKGDQSVRLETSPPSVKMREARRIAALYTSISCLVLMPSAVLIHVLNSRYSYTSCSKWPLRMMLLQSPACGYNPISCYVWGLSLSTQLRSTELVELPTDCSTAPVPREEETT